MMRGIVAFVVALALGVLGLCLGIEAAASPERVVTAAPTTTTTSSTTTTTTTAPAVLIPPQIEIQSTAYCETGNMVTGRPAHDGAVSSKVLPRYSRWRVLSGRFAGAVFTVEDTGSLAYFDIAMPGRCEEAAAYGRRPIYIEGA